VKRNLLPCPPPSVEGSRTSVAESRRRGSPSAPRGITPSSSSLKVEVSYAEVCFPTFLRPALFDGAERALLDREQAEGRCQQPTARLASGLGGSTGGRRSSAPSGQAGSSRRSCTLGVDRRKAQLKIRLGFAVSGGCPGRRSAGARTVLVLVDGRREVAFGDPGPSVASGWGRRGENRVFFDLGRR